MICYSLGFWSSFKICANQNIRVFYNEARGFKLIGNHEVMKSNCLLINL